MNIWKVILATLVIFGAGVVVGSLLTKHTASDAQTAPHPAGNQTANPWAMRNLQLLRRMDRELALTAEQHDRIEKIMTGSKERTQSLWSPIAVEMDKETESVCEEIRDVLTPEQRTKFDNISKPGRGGPPRGGDRGFQRGGGERSGERGERGRRRGGTNFPGGGTNRIFTNSPATNQDGG